MGVQDQDIVRRWRDVCLGSSKPLLNPRRSNVAPARDIIYSYGSHFEMARIIRDKKREPVLWLINGDTYSVTTSRHQGEVRAALRGSSVPQVTIPHRALGAAGIDLASVKLVQDMGDRFERWTETRNEFPEGAVWREDDVTDSWEEGHYADQFGPAPQGAGDIGPDGKWDSNLKRDPYSAVWRSTIRVIDKPREHHMENHLYTSRRFLDQWTVNEDGTYSIERSRHWLGASLITAEVPYTVMQKCRSCKGTGEGTDLIPTWVTSHYEGEEWIPGYTGTEIGCAGCRGAKLLTVSKRRRAYFLSAFDENETRPSYFFCELPPKARPKTVDEALEALKPESVKLAESMARTVLRQGDVFAIPMPGVTLKSLRMDGATVSKSAFILGVNHRGTDVATVPVKRGVVQTYVRGTIRHDPGQFRRPDHKRLILGDRKTWHLVVKNTVPTS